MGEAERWCHRVLFKTHRCVKIHLCLLDPGHWGKLTVLPQSSSWIWEWELGKREWKGLGMKKERKGKERKGMERERGNGNKNWGTFRH